MSNEALKKMQKELDRSRRDEGKLRNQLLQLQDHPRMLNEAKTEIEELKKQLHTDVAAAKKESTVRAKEQIEQLREENEKLTAELERTKKLLDQTADEVKLSLQKATQAEAHMREMASTQQAQPKAKTYRKDRIRRSQR